MDSIDVSCLQLHSIILINKELTGLNMLKQDALNKAGQRAKGADILVIRLKKDGSFGLAKPCFNCEFLINKAEINRRDWT